jgi:methionine-rich copper-binding protein CopC
MIRIGLLAMLGLGVAGPAFAHAFLQRASPPVGGELAASPPTVAISFTEAVEPLFSTIEVHDPTGAAVAVGKPHAAGGGKQLIVDLPKLSPGKYTVIWHVTSVDTHKTEGRYSFTVTP